MKKRPLFPKPNKFQMAGVVSHKPFLRMAPQYVARSRPDGPPEAARDAHAAMWAWLRACRASGRLLRAPCPEDTIGEDPYWPEWVSIVRIRDEIVACTKMPISLVRVIRFVREAMPGIAKADGRIQRDIGQGQVRFRRQQKMYRVGPYKSGDT